MPACGGTPVLELWWCTGSRACKKGINVQDGVEASGCPIKRGTGACAVHLPFLLDK
jgi:hypothetical protein